MPDEHVVRVPLSAAASRAGVSVSTLRRWIREGRLPAVRVGAKAIRVSVADIDALTRPVIDGGSAGSACKAG